MYIRKTSRTYKGKTYCNYLLVESILTPKGPRQRIVCSLGDLSPRPKQQWLELARKLEDSLTGQNSLFPAGEHSPEIETLVAKVQASPGLARMPVSPSGQPMVAVDADGVRIEQSREAGPVHVGHRSGSAWRSTRSSPVSA